MRRLGLIFCVTLICTVGMIGGTPGHIIAGDMMWMRNENFISVSSFMIEEVFMPKLKTKAEKELGISKMPKAVGYLRYTKQEIKTFDEDIIGVTAGMAWDLDNKSTAGFLVPYDNLDSDFIDAQRYGVTGYYKYMLDINSYQTISAVGTLDYVCFEPDRGDNINEYALGIGANYVYDKGEMIVPGAALAYRYGKNDSDAAVDDQHLLLFGANCGFRIQDQSMVKIFGVYYEDVTSDLPDSVETHSWDLGAEFKYDVSQTFELSVGYKRVLGIDDFTSDMIYLGTFFQF